MWHVSSRSGVATLGTAIHLLLTYLLAQIQCASKQLNENRRCVRRMKHAPISVRFRWWDREQFARRLTEIFPSYVKWVMAFGTKRIRCHRPCMYAICSAETQHSHHHSSSFSDGSIGGGAVVAIAPRKRARKIFFNVSENKSGDRKL